MDLSPILVIFRIIGVEFSNVADDIVCQWIDLTIPLVSRKRFAHLYYQAVALLTAHRMKMAGMGITTEDPLADIGQMGVGNLTRVASYSEGETSISFNQNLSQFTDKDAELALTIYGIQYLTLRNMRIMPIISAGETFGVRV